MKKVSTLRFRPLTQFEAALIRKLLDVDDPLYARLRDQIPHLWSSVADPWGTFWLAPGGVEEQPEPAAKGALPYLGITRNEDGGIVQFAVFVNDDDRLVAVEITRLDGEPLRGSVDPATISVRKYKPGEAF